MAATLGEDDLGSVDQLQAALTNLGVVPEDRLIRPVAAEGFADEGIHISL